MNEKPTKQRVRFLAVVSTSDGGSFVQGGCSQSPSPRPRGAALASPPPPQSPGFSPSFTSTRVPPVIDRDVVTIERVGVALLPFPTKNCKTLHGDVGKGAMEKKKRGNTPPKHVGKAGVAQGAFSTNYRESPPTFVGKASVTPGAFSKMYDKSLRKFAGKTGVTPGTFPKTYGKNPTKFVGQGSMEKNKLYKTPPKYGGKGSMGKKAADQASKMKDRQSR